MLTTAANAAIDAQPAQASPDHRRNNFDLLRLIAALLVVGGHVELPYFGHTVDWYARVSGFQSGGGLGVAIFFVISGYLVAQSRRRSSSLARFALNRFLRIVPGLAGCILLVAIAVWPVSGMPFRDYFVSGQMAAFLLNILVFPVNPCTAPIGAGYAYGCNLTGPTWSLTYEVVMYVFVGLIGFAARKTQLRVSLTGLAAILVLIMRDVLFPLGEWNLSVSGINLFSFIAHRGLPFIGLFLAGSLLNHLPRAVLLNPLLFGVALALYIGSFRTNPALHTFVQGLALPAIVLWLGLQRWHAAGGLYDRVGDLSYGIFLYHWPVMTVTWICLHQKLPLYAMTLVFAVVTLAIAYASYHVIEKPALSLKGGARLRRHTYSPPVDADPAALPGK